jgi:hypothetical protein
LPVALRGGTTPFHNPSDTQAQFTDAGPARMLVPHLGSRAIRLTTEMSRRVR